MNVKKIYKVTLFLITSFLLLTLWSNETHAGPGDCGYNRLFGTCPSGEECVVVAPGTSFSSYACQSAADTPGVCGYNRQYGTCSAGRECVVINAGTSFSTWACQDHSPTDSTCGGGCPPTESCQPCPDSPYACWQCRPRSEEEHAEGEYDTMAECNAACIGICRAATGGGYYCTPSSDDWEDEPGGGTGEAGPPASFTFDILPWIRNMYELSHGRSLDTFAGILYRIALPIAVVLGMIMVGVAGLGIMTSEGDPSKAMNAKNQLTSAIIGLLFVLLGAGILRALINTLFTGDGTITGL